MLSIKSLIFSLIVGLLLIGCDDWNSSNRVEFRVIETNCTQENRVDEYGNIIDNRHTYIFYRYDIEERLLYIRHYNVPFNCDKRGIATKVSITDNSIVIKEYQNLLENEGMRCVCLYDIYLTIDNIDPKEYLLNIINEATNDKIGLNIDLIEKPQAVIAFKRDYYQNLLNSTTDKNNQLAVELINDKFYNLNLLPNSKTQVIKSQDELTELIEELRGLEDKKSLEWADILEKQKNTIDFSREYILFYTFTKGCSYIYNSAIEYRVNGDKKSQTLKIILRRENEICPTVMTKYLLVYKISNQFKKVEIVVDNSNPIVVYSE